MDCRMIRDARKRKGITQDELAKKLGINRATLSRYETGAIDPPMSQVEKILDVLELSPANFISSEEKEEIEEVADAMREWEADPNKIEEYKRAAALDALGRRAITASIEAREKADQATIEAFKDISDRNIRAWSIELLDHMNRSGRIEALQILEVLSENPRYRLPFDGDEENASSVAEDISEGPQSSVEGRK